VLADDADRWRDELLLSDVEKNFMCPPRDQRGAHIGPDCRAPSGSPEPPLRWGPMLWGKPGCERPES
jgi:hypothetical protein